MVITFLITVVPHMSCCKCYFRLILGRDEERDGNHILITASARFNRFLVPSYGINTPAMLEGALVTPEASTLSTMYS